MSETTPKPLKVIEAQIATFASERVMDPGYRDHIFDNLGNLAIEGTKDDLTDEYTDFMRSVGGMKYEALRGRIEILKEYDRFKSVISVLKAELVDSVMPEHHPNYLGSGANARTLLIVVEDAPYVVRMSTDDNANSEWVDGHLAAAVLGRGIPHLEHLVAASYEDRVTVAEVMPGKEVGGLTLDEIGGVSDSQLAEFIDTMSAVSNRGILIDYNSSNTFYDPEEGYGIIDYHSSVARHDQGRQDLGTIVGFMADNIGGANLYGNVHEANKTIEDYAHDLESMRASFDVLVRYRSLVEQKLSDWEKQTALKEIDSVLKYSQDMIMRYDSPRWVAAQIAKDEERNRGRKKQEAEQTPKTRQTPTLDGWGVI